MPDSILRLQSASTDVVIKTHPFAEIIYWGPHLSHFLPQDTVSLVRPVANGRLDIDTPVTLMAELGHGLFGAPGIEGHRQGLDASPIFTTTGVVQDGKNLTITSEDVQAGLRLCSEIQLDNSGVLSLSWFNQPARAALAGGPSGDYAACRRACPRSDGLSWPLDPRIPAPSSDSRT